MNKAASIAVFSLFVLLFGIICFSNADNVSGVIHFEKGDKLEFHNILYLNAFLKGYRPTNEAIPVKYGEEVKFVPFTELKSFKVVEFGVFNVPRDTGPPTKIWRGAAEVETTDGNKVICRYDSLGRADVEILDPSTKGVAKKTIFIIDFKSKGLNIREIKFNN